MQDSDFIYPHGEEPDDMLYGDVRLGDEVQNFILTDQVGKYLWNRARMDRVAAIDAMEKLIPTDPNFQKKLYEAQINAAMPRRLIEYLREAFMAAASAENELRVRDEQDFNH